MINMRRSSNGPRRDCRSDPTMRLRCVTGQRA